MTDQPGRTNPVHNPYAPPQADDALDHGSLESSELHIASQGRRFVNLIVDYIGFTILSFVFGMMLGLTGQASVLGALNGYIVGILIIFIYYVPMETLFGFTLGKLLTGTRVVMEDGSRPDFGRILLRTLCRLIPFEPLSFLGGGDAPVGWHDRLSKTRVIHVRN